MKTYRTTFEGKTFQYYYDHHIKLWTIYEIDEDGFQTSEEANHFHDKTQLKSYYPFLDFKQ